jgi:hypothetical protein
MSRLKLQARQLIRLSAVPVVVFVALVVVTILRHKSWVGLIEPIVIWAVFIFASVWGRPWYRRQVAKPVNYPQGPWPDESTLGRWRRKRQQAADS